MGTSFEALTRVAREERSETSSRHRITFDEKAAIWSVNGGYLAAAMLRAAEDLSGHERPASLSLQFLRGVAPGEATVATTSMKRGATSELLEARISQKDKLAVLGHLWAHSGQRSADLRRAIMPTVPHPDELRSQDDMRAGKGPQHPFYEAFEQRRMNMVDWGVRRNSQPHALSWVRYKDLESDTSPYLRAAMTVPMIDITGVAAACNAYGSNILTTLAPTIQLTAHFYELDELSTWFLTDAHTECVSDGLLNSRVQIWSERGALVAQGLTQMVFTAGAGHAVETVSGADKAEPASA